MQLYAGVSKVSTHFLSLSLSLSLSLFLSLFLCTCTLFLKSILLNHCPKWAAGFGEERKKLAALPFLPSYFPLSLSLRLALSLGLSLSLALSRSLFCLSFPAPVMRDSTRRTERGESGMFRFTFGWQKPIEYVRSIKCIQIKKRTGSPQSNTLSIGNSTN